MDEKKKKALWGVFAVVLVAVAVIWFMGSGLEHIEDVNGADDTSLTTITDQQIIDQSIGALNVGTQTGFINGMVEISSKKFTGVYEVLYNNYIGPSDFVLELSDFTVSGGNFKMCVVHDGEIVAVLEPDAFVEYTLENISGTVALVIAGESAEFSFEMTEFAYNNFVHN